MLVVFAVAGESVAYGSGNRLEANRDSSFVAYHIYHLFHSVDGVSKSVSCSVEVDSSVHRIIRVSVETEVKTFNSGNDTRDKTAMKAIEADKYPVVTFRSDSIMYDSDTTASVRGKLNFHGVVTEIIMPVTVVSRTGETVCDGSTQLTFDAFNVDRPALIFIPIGNTFIVKFHMVFDRKL